MSRTIEQPSIEQASTGLVTLAATPSVPAKIARPRALSSQNETERLWLQEGFEPPTPDLEDFLAQAPAAALRNTYRIAVLLFLSMVALACVLKVDIIVAGSGRLAADSPMIVVQPMQLSVIRQIRVRPGDIVHKGDVLAALDPTFTQADRAVLLAQRSAVRAQTARLEAELEGRGLVPDGSPEFQLQESLYRQRQAQYDVHAGDFTMKIDAYGVEIAAAEQSRVSADQQLALSREVEAMRNSLFRAQSGSKLVWLEAQAARVRNEREVQAAAAHVDALKQAMRSSRAELQGFRDTWRRDLLESLLKARADALAIDEGVTKANRLNELVVLSAPEDGVVLDVARRSVGSVLNAAEPLITLVPSDAALIAEIAISSADIGYTKAGDTVALKVDAFPYQRHGLLSGRLRSIAADSVTQPGGQAGGAQGVMHRGLVEVTGDDLKGLPEGARLIPGMSVTAEIKVGTRSVISYLVYPLTRGISESIREP